MKITRKNSGKTGVLLLFFGHLTPGWQNNKIFER